MWIVGTLGPALKAGEVTLTTEVLWGQPKHAQNGRNHDFAGTCVISVILLHRLLSRLIPSMPTMQIGDTLGPAPKVIEVAATTRGLW